MVTSQKRLSLNVCYWCPINLFRVKTKAIVRGFAALWDYRAKSNTFVSFRPIIFQDNVDYSGHLVSTGNFDKMAAKKVYHDFVGGEKNLRGDSPKTRNKGPGSESHLSNAVFTLLYSPG